MALLDDVETRLSTQSVGGIAGSTSVTDTGWLITKTYMPPDPDKVITIYETGGSPPEPRAEVDYPTFQVRVRSGTTGYSTGMEKLAAVQMALHGLTATHNSWYYPGFWAQGDALSLGFDQETRPILAQNFRAARSRTS